MVLSPCSSLVLLYSGDLKSFGGPVIYPEWWSIPHSLDSGKTHPSTISPLFTVLSSLFLFQFHLSKSEL